MTADPYTQSGEFLDVFSRDAWQALRPAVVEAMRHAAPGQEPIVDVGAGTGLGTLLVAEAVPDVDIIAVEPSPILRAVLLARVAGDEALRRRVTVVAAGVEDVRLPSRLGGVLAINMLGHLSPQRRRVFWNDLRARLAPSAPLIVNLQPPAEVTTVPQTTFASVQIGRHIYEGSGAARPSGENTVTWTMRYRILDPGGAVERELVADYPWHVITPAQVLDELTAAGFAARLRELDVVVATPHT
ncbi:class I SAM-dependent methyltransferase [Micromonospora sp. CB01531]|uniref:class I SAM-dependent methyltransferase n=1 Tax=Micromonospora sp. CB01531 TaxID=1718947 RepID=UPI00093A8B4A|nr:class I SAM-dependent methyltransferase [Micromonospora sp. CB01531]OKI71634.1 hypothetical protein A6A27_19790 [Micromonospora sp. CB01531]